VTDAYAEVDGERARATTLTADLFGGQDTTATQPADRPVVIRT
jgi:hypothetical protein